MGTIRHTPAPTIRENGFHSLHILLPWKAAEGGGRLADAEAFAVIGATIADNFGLDMPDGTIGTSVLDQLR